MDRASLQRTVRVQTAPTCRIQVGSSSKTGNSHWGGGRSDDATDVAPTEQHGVALDFIVKEERDAATATTTTASSGTTPRVQSLKRHVSNYVGKEGEPLLRWLVEVDTAIAARRIFDDPSKVAFAMSCLGGRARSWAYGRRLPDATCFGTYAEFKEELRQAFEPPKNEFRSRAEFLYCSKVSITFMLMPNGHGTWSRTS
ncbi:hypothetical protein PC121_g23552 [Phytophthora cactorum]|nr:hypothetical protein PC121_g23552 [Phytophthora cactorum]